MGCSASRKNYSTGVEVYRILSETFDLDSITDILEIISITKEINYLHKVFHCFKFIQKTYKKIQLNLVVFWNSFTHFELFYHFVVIKLFII